jgi:protein-S-isoprenylcysteine O-methyltransferase Ste14
MDKKINILICLLEILTIFSAMLISHLRVTILTIIPIVLTAAIFAAVIVYTKRTVPLKELRQRIFTLRSYTPLPFLLAMIVLGRPTISTIFYGAVIAGFGEFVRAWGVAYAGSLTRVTGSVGAPEVIVAGPFAYVRNPLYVGNLLTYVGIGIMANAIFPWLVVAALAWFIFQYRQIVALEEEFLKTTFGSAYEEYSKNVPRFIPRREPYKNPAQEHQKPNWDEAAKSEHRTFQALGIVLALVIVLWLIQ